MNDIKVSTGHNRQHRIRIATQNQLAKSIPSTLPHSSPQHGRPNYSYTQSWVLGTRLSSCRNAHLEYRSDDVHVIPPRLGRT